MADLNALPEGLPAPADDGAAARLLGRRFPAVKLQATTGQCVDVSAQSGTVVAWLKQP